MKKYVSLQRDLETICLTTCKVHPYRHKNKVMIRLQKFKFGCLFELLETKDTKAITKALTDYRYCGDGLYMHTKIVGQYAKVDVIVVNLKPVKSI